MTTFTARHTNGQRCDRATRTHDCPGLLSVWLTPDL